MRMGKDATRAVSMFAFNNELIDYGKLAIMAGWLVSKNMYCEALQLFTDEKTLNTNEAVFRKIFDKIVILDPKLPRETGTLRPYYSNGEYKQATYYNTYRTDIFDLTEFDENIVIDVDYLVLNESLNRAWNASHDLLMNREFIFALDFEKNLDSPEHIRISDTSIPMRWATVVYFKKTDATARFFEIAKEVSEKYRYYSLVYGFRSGQYRNDYIFSVADHVMGGYCSDGYSRPLPDKTMIMTKEKHTISQVNQQLIHIHDDKNRSSLCPTNIHIMNKESLQDAARGFTTTYGV
jgi:hypothetical protein